MLCVLAESLLTSCRSRRVTASLPLFHGLLAVVQHRLAVVVHAVTLRVGRVLRDPSDASPVPDRDVPITVEPDGPCCVHSLLCRLHLQHDRDSVSGRDDLVRAADRFPSPRLCVVVLWFLSVHVPLVATAQTR